MGYMLPLKFIKVNSSQKKENGFDVSICATRIVAIMSVKCYQARRTLQEERKNGTLINACGRGAAESIIFLDNGTIIAQPFSVNKLLNAIEMSNMKPPRRGEPRETVRMRIYDVRDEDPRPELENEDIPELQAMLDDRVLLDDDEAEADSIIEEEIEEDTEESDEE